MFFTTAFLCIFLSACSTLTKILYDNLLPLIIMVSTTSHLTPGVTKLYFQGKQIRLHLPVLLNFRQTDKIK